MALDVSQQSDVFISANNRLSVPVCVGVGDVEAVISEPMAETQHFAGSYV